MAVAKLGKKAGVSEQRPRPSPWFRPKIRKQPPADGKLAKEDGGGLQEKDRFKQPKRTLARIESFLETQINETRDAAAAARDELIQAIRDAGGIAQREIILKQIASAVGLSATFQRARTTLVEPPKTAPKLWRERSKDSVDSPVQFIVRHYAEWLGRGLTLPDIKHVDPGLYRAYFDWLGSGHRAPSDFYLPTKDEWNDRLLAEPDLLVQLDEVSRGKLYRAAAARVSRARAKTPKKHL